MGRRRRVLGEGLTFRHYAPSWAVLGSVFCVCFGRGWELWYVPTIAHGCLMLGPHIFGRRLVYFTTLLGIETAVGPSMSYAR